MFRLRRRTDTLLADSLMMEDDETQEQTDDDELSEETCPECGGRMTMTGACAGKRGAGGMTAGCGYQKPMMASSADKVQKVMHEFKTGKLRLPAPAGKKRGAKVTSRKQAIAIALSEAGQSRPMRASAFTAEERRKMADAGEALPDGSYPIPNVEYLRKAIGALGRASQHGDYERVKRHIVKRARALDALEELPKDWDVTAAVPFRSPFDESKHRRKPRGVKGGGQFTVKENAAGRFEVVDDATGKKVAEATTETDANAIADHRNEAAPYTPPAEAPAPAPSPVEGPFTYPSGWTGRYDPVEGRYIGMDDLYMPADFDPTRDPGRSAMAMPDKTPAVVTQGPPELSAMTDAEVEQHAKALDELATKQLTAKDPNWIDTLGAKRDAENEVTRRRVSSIVVSDELAKEADTLEQSGPKASGFIGTTNVRKTDDGRYEVFERDRTNMSSTYPVFTGSKAEVAAYAQRELDNRRTWAADSARRAADAALEGGKDYNKGRVTLDLGTVPNDWAVQNGYATYVEAPKPRSSGYGYSTPSVGPVQTIRWNPDTNPEAVLFHFIGGKPAPAGFAEGTRGAEQFGYGRGKLKGKNKAEREAIVRRITAALIEQGFVFDSSELIASLMADDGDEADAIVASIPVHPPAEWFANPELDGPTPITITSDGRIYGHAALWGTCHLGNPRGAGVCVQPPRSQTDYGLFHLGELETAEGARVPVGQITLDTGHAPLGASARSAAAHYDDTGSVVADVGAGEDEHGIYFAGALRPDATPEKVRKLLAAKISGDWRGGELVGMLAVNVPGFPVPRTKARLVADAGGTEEVMALVAAGIVGEHELDARELEIRVQVLAARAEGGIEGLAELAER